MVDIRADQARIVSGSVLSCSGGLLLFEVKVAYGVVL